MFIIENDKTYIVNENDRQEFGDFCLKLLGELIFEGDTVDREGHWVASCSAYVRGVLETRLGTTTTTLLLNIYGSLIFSWSRSLFVVV